MISLFSLLLLQFIQQPGCSGQFSALPSSQTVTVGGDASFECTASNGANNVLWDIRRGANTVVRITTLNNASLDISALDVDRALLLGPLGSPLVLEGIGQGMNGTTAVCLTPSMDGLGTVTQEEPFAILNVLSPAKFVTEPNSSYAGTRGDTLTINVIYEGDAPVISTLTKDSGPIREASSSSMIVFEDLKCSDAGNYTLRIHNGIGPGATATFELNVTGAAISVPDASPVSLSSSGQALFSLNKIVNVCPPNSLSTIACIADQEGITVIATLVEENEVMLTANPVPQSGQRLNLNCTDNGGNIIVFSVTQSIYCDARCIAGIVVAVFFLTFILIATIFIILCCCCCDCCKGKKKTKPERLTNKGQELS